MLGPKKEKEKGGIATKRSVETVPSVSLTPQSSVIGRSPCWSSQHCSPQPEGHLWACRSLLSVWVPSHSEEWVLRSPGLAVGRASTAPLNQRVTYEHAAPVWASEFLRPPELCDRSLALLVEPALLPSTRGSSMSLPLPSERLSSLSLRGMSSSPLQGIERSSNKCARETLGTF